MSRPRISVCTPIHSTPDTARFLTRIADSLRKQTFRDFEWVITNEGSMPVNTNKALDKATGEVIQILYMDDYLYSPTALECIYRNFRGGWAASICVHDDGERIRNTHVPMWSPEAKQGVNTIGSPSVVVLDGDCPERFDERMSWMLDIDFYQRLYARYGEPQILGYPNIAIGLGSHQMTHQLSQEQKDYEVRLFHEKHGTD